MRRLRCIEPTGMAGQGRAGGRCRPPPQGLVVMSQQLDMVSTALYNNVIPDSWADKAYPSLKPLSAWVIDLVARTDALEAWYQRGACRPLTGGERLGPC